MAHPETTLLILAILDKIVAEIDDKRTLPGGRQGLRLAHIIVRQTADVMGVKYE